MAVSFDRASVAAGFRTCLPVAVGVGGGPAVWSAAGLPALVAWKTDNLLAALGVAMVAMVALRSVV